MSITSHSSHSSHPSRSSHASQFIPTHQGAFSAGIVNKHHLHENLWSHTVTLSDAGLTLEDVYAVAYCKARVEIAPAVIERLQKARDLVEELAYGEAPVYGINTGFGALAEKKISPEDLGTLQRNLIISHAVGMGAPLAFAQARALLLLRANTLVAGHSGCRPLILQTMVCLLNAGIAPLVPSKGSVGASGDLAPLAHTCLLLLGEGDAFRFEQRVSAAEALAAAGVAPVTLEAKEGLALINGTQAMASVGTLALLEAEKLADLADIFGAASLDALEGTVVAMDPRIHAARPHPGQIHVAAYMRALLHGSQIKERRVSQRVQDAYSLRCIPQVHGATRDALAYVRRVLTTEINSATDNPLVFLDGDHGVAGTAILSGGNFHGQPLALALDFLAIAVAELANISERRVEQLVNPSLSAGLPAFLSPDAGLNSGLMIVQVTAAALVNENKVLCHPASIDSIPTSANREDHVSMGMTSANKAQMVVENVRRVLAIECFCACQALDLRRQMLGEPAVQFGQGPEALLRVVRSKIPFAPADRLFARDLALMESMCAADVLHTAVYAALHRP